MSNQIIILYCLNLRKKKLCCEGRNRADHVVFLESFFLSIIGDRPILFNSSPNEEFKIGPN